MRLSYMLAVLLCSCLLLQNSFARQSEKRKIKGFQELEVSPYIDVILKYGESPLVHIQADDKLQMGDIVTKVKDNKLEVYIKGYQNTDKRQAFPFGRVNVVIYYREISLVELQGDGYLWCGDEINNHSLELNLYGDNDVRLNKVIVHDFKASLFGNGKLNVKEGKAGSQFIRAFGKNEILTSGFVSAKGKLTTYGDASFKVHITESLKVNTFGQSDIRCKGNPTIDRHNTEGQSSIYVVRP